MAGEGTQVGMQGAACGIQPSADEWARDTKATGPFIMQADVRVGISPGDGDRAMLLSITQGKLQPGPGPEVGLAAWTAV